MPAPKVGFLVIGAQKAGTTTLDHYLRQHPDIGMADVKEVHYFDDEDRFAGHRRSHSDYEAHFPGERLIHGEVTPIYLYWNPCRDRIHQYNARMKMIALLRHPAERAYSHWNMEVNRGAEDRDFLSCVTAEIRAYESGTREQHRVRSYVDRGRYAEQLLRIRERFPEEQLLLLRHDDLRDAPEACIARVHAFLGVPFIPPSSMRIAMNAGSYHDPMPVEARRIITTHLRRDTERLADLWNADLSPWLS